MLNCKTTILFLLVLSLGQVSAAQEGSSISESGLHAAKSVVLGASAVTASGAYATAERNACNFLVPASTPRCMNSIFGLLQKDLLLLNLDKSIEVAKSLLGDTNPHLLIDLKADDFCIHPLTDSCVQDVIDVEAEKIYLTLKMESLINYEAYVSGDGSLRDQVNIKLKEFEDNGYVINKIAMTVQPPGGTAQTYQDGENAETSVADPAAVSTAGIATTATNKFAGTVARFDSLIAEQDAILAESAVDAGALIAVAAGLAAGSLIPSEPVAPAPGGEFSSKTGTTKSPGQLFFAELTDVQRSVSSVAPQGEEVFGSVSSRYKKMQKSGEFIQP
jgi:hypothetical protein